MKIINCTPHPITLNSGEVYEPNKDMLIRIPNSYSEPDQNGFTTITYGEIEGLPQEQAGVYYIVSSIIKLAAPYRNDLLIPATNHEACIRNEKGFIVSVPFLCK